MNETIIREYTTRLIEQKYDVYFDELPKDEQEVHLNTVREWFNKRIKFSDNNYDYLAQTVGYQGNFSREGISKIINEMIQDALTNSMPKIFLADDFISNCVESYKNTSLDRVINFELIPDSKKLLSELSNEYGITDEQALNVCVEIIADTTYGMSVGHKVKWTEEE